MINLTSASSLQFGLSTFPVKPIWIPAGFPFLSVTLTAKTTPTRCKETHDCRGDLRGMERPPPPPNWWNQIHLTRSEFLMGFGRGYWGQQTRCMTPYCRGSWETSIHGWDHHLSHWSAFLCLASYPSVLFPAVQNNVWNTKSLHFMKCNVNLSYRGTLWAPCSPHVCFNFSHLHSVKETK